MYRSSVELESFIDSIKVKYFGKEVVLQVKTNIKNEKVFYTDSNGLEL